MKTITQILGGAQALLDVNFDLQDSFEEYLTDGYKTFLHILRVVEEFLPLIIRARARTGRPPYGYLPFLRSILAKNYFEIDKTCAFIQRLRGEPGLRLLCGFEKVPSEATFSRMFAYLAEQHIWEHVFDALVKKAHEGKVVYHINRDSTTIPARETPIKKEKQPVEKVPKKRGRPAKNESKTPKMPTTLEEQVNEDPAVSLEKLNKNCAWGCKKIARDT